MVPALWHGRELGVNSPSPPLPIHRVPGNGFQGYSVSGKVSRHQLPKPFRSAPKVPERSLTLGPHVVCQPSSLESTLEPAREVVVVACQGSRSGPLNSPSLLQLTSWSVCWNLSTRVWIHRCPIDLSIRLRGIFLKEIPSSRRIEKIPKG